MNSLYHFPLNLSNHSLNHRKFKTYPLKLRELWRSWKDPNFSSPSRLRIYLPLIPSLVTFFGTNFDTDISVVVWKWSQPLGTSNIPSQISWRGWGWRLVWVDYSLLLPTVFSFSMDFKLRWLFNVLTVLGRTDICFNHISIHTFFRGDLNSTERSRGLLAEYRFTKELKIFSNTCYSM